MNERVSIPAKLPVADESYSGRKFVRNSMLGLEFDFPIKELRKNLIFEHKIFTGSAKNPNLLRILPSLTVKKEHIDALFNAIKSELS